MTPQQLDRASRIRQQILHALTALQAKVEHMLAVRSLLAGSLYEWAHRCGKPSCHCARGELHVHWVLSYPEHGKLRKVYVRPEELAGVRRDVHAYRLFRRARAELVKDCDRLLKALDQLEKSCRAAPPSRERRTEDE